MPAAMVKAGEALTDIKAGMSDFELMSKYRLSARGLGSLFRKLVALGALDPVELEIRRLSLGPDTHEDTVITEQPREQAPERPETPGARQRTCLLLSDRSDIESRIAKAIDGSDHLRLVTRSPAITVDEIKDISPALVSIDYSAGPERSLSLISSIKQEYEIGRIMVLISENSGSYVESLLKAGAHEIIFMDQDIHLIANSLWRASQFAELLSFKRDHLKVMEEEIEERTIDLVQTKDFLKGILDSSTLVSVIATDMDQSVLFWNKGAENIFGYTADEMVGSKIHKLYPPDDNTLGAVDQLRRQARNQVGTFYAKLNQVTKTGDTVTISLAITPMVNSLGEVQGILGVGLDVTEEVKQQKEIIDLLNQVSKTQDVTVFTLAKLAESRDEETGFHLVRIQRYCRILAEGMIGDHPEGRALDDRYINDLVQSSVLHDIGKVAIPDAILMCKDKFTPEQKRRMENHTLFGGMALEEGVRNLGEKSFLSLGMEVAYYHHERWDGKGYPKGLKGAEIPLSARIVALADVYDALTTKRRYKEAFTHEDAVVRISSASGAQFDPDIVRVFQLKEREFMAVREELS